MPGPPYACTHVQKGHIPCQVVCSKSDDTSKRCPDARLHGQDTHHLETDLNFALSGGARGPSLPDPLPGSPSADPCLHSGVILWAELQTLLSDQKKVVDWLADLPYLDSDVLFTLGEAGEATLPNQPGGSRPPS